MSTAECQKCRSEIPTDAERCPDCGYEPASEHNLGQTIATLIALPICLFFGLIAIIIPLLVIDGGLDFGSAAIGFVFFGAIAAVSGFYLYAIKRTDDLTPTDDELDIFNS